MGLWQEVRSDASLRLVQLDQVLSLTTSAINRLIKMLRLAGQRGDRITDIEPLRCRLDACHDLARFVSALGLILEAGKGPNFFSALLGTAHAQIVSNLPAQAVEYGVASQAKNEAGSVGFAHVMASVRP